MSNESQLDLIVNSLAIGVGLIGLIGIWLHKRDDANATHRGPLTWLIFLLSAGCVFLVAQAADVVPETSAVLVASLMTIVPIPALTWLYVVRLTSQTADSPRIKRKHWIMTIAYGVLILPLLAAPELALGAEPAEEVMIRVRVLVALLCFALFLLLWFAHLARVGFLTVRQVRSYRKRLQDAVSDTEGLELRWIDGLMIFIAGSILLFLIDLGSAFILPEPLLGPIAEDFFSLGVVTGLVVFGLKQSTPRPVFESSVDLASDDAETESGQASYDRSSFSEQDCRMLAFQLDALMSSEKRWLDPFLDLKTLSRMVGSKPYYVTQALNTVCERNFYRYVNSWRVEEAARLLLETNDNVLAISELSGFNSKSTFNSTFRKEKGLTPSAYRKEKGALVAA
ncbi:helix-turn-helix transcriptional regulator [Pacificimonas sp. WHA3]|uniref:Helix-turn-helix transcriptional regulator n=1 Tax=Pacificimonas pallii TaxID=2827236 RepID=A0ABS6SDZ8_9SPHN|nr:helix-turn-helix transcriptional regulator [Pacificimonas pallii]MBV7256141.1 helix-turn-helix transcriptional regulator [Pacificimonas pallii]